MKNRKLGFDEVQKHRSAGEVVSDGQVSTSNVDKDSKAFVVDLDSPLVFQVGHLGEAYEQWVHQPVVSKKTPRFFQNNLLEHLTRTPWWVVPLVWIPAVFWCEMTAARRGLPIASIGPALLFGLFLWTLVEYSMHRFLFHIKTSSYWGNTAHYLLHGCHHKHPMDGYRLVFPPAATAAFICLFWPAIAVLFPYAIAPAVFGGGLLGYVMYDMTHYFLHHGVAFNKRSRNLKRYHLNHHFKSQQDSYGITSALWDWVFGTLPAVFQTK